MQASPSKFSSQTHLNLSHWVPATGAEGPGRRFALWVQGCAIRCPGCCNPEMFGFVPRHVMSVDEVLEKILQAREQHQIEGISCLGGEPFAQSTVLSALARRVRAEGLSVMIFSGYTIEQIKAGQEPDSTLLLDQIDILIDGPYEQDRHTEERRWIGSTNQRVHFLTERYDPEDPCWQERNSVEVYFDGKELRITGFPKKEWRDEIIRWRRQLEKARAEK